MERGECKVRRVGERDVKVGGREGTWKHVSELLP